MQSEGNAVFTLFLYQSFYGIIDFNNSISEFTIMHAKKVSWVILFAILAAFITFPIAARERAVFLIGVEDMPYYPYSEIDKDNYIGINRDILAAFFTSKGYKFEFFAVPYLRNMRNLLAGVIDFQFPDDPDWLSDLKKGHTIIYSDHAVSYIDGVSVLPARKGKGIDSLKILGTVIGFSPIDYYKLINSGEMILRHNSSVKGLILQVMAGRVDGIYLSVDVVNQHLKRMGKVGEVVFDDSLPFRTGGYSLSTIKHPKIIKEFNHFLKEESALLNELKARYGLK